MARRLNPRFRPSATAGSGITPVPTETWSHYPAPVDASLDHREL